MNDEQIKASIENYVRAQVAPISALDIVVAGVYGAQMRHIDALVDEGRIVVVGFKHGTNWYRRAVKK